jgi:hypothetical protein
MAISFQSDEEVLRKLRDRLRKMTDQELIQFGKEVRRLAENPFHGNWMRQERSGSGGNCNQRVRIAEPQCHFDLRSTSELAGTL